MASLSDTRALIRTIDERLFELTDALSTAVGNDDIMPGAAGEMSAALEALRSELATLTDEAEDTADRLEQRGWEVDELRESLATFGADIRALEFERWQHGASEDSKLIELASTIAAAAIN